MSALWLALLLPAMLLAFGVGRARGINLGRAKLPPEPPEPYCGCDHHLSMHDPQTGKCHEETLQSVGGGKAKRIQCGCRQYVGPIPSGAMILPPTLPPPVVTS